MGNSMGIEGKAVISPRRCGDRREEEERKRNSQAKQQPRAP
jgi:hypothetical protein